MKAVQLSTVEDRIVTIRNQKVLLDFDVAELYGVETKRVNEAVRNNPEKFPNGYIIELNIKEIRGLRSKFSTANLTMSRVAPKVFTEKGLYMLATILKSPKATATTIMIIETFAKIKSFVQTINQVAIEENVQQQKSLVQKSAEIISEIIGEDMHTSKTKTTLEFNFAIMKIKHTVERSSGDTTVVKESEVEYGNPPLKEPFIEIDLSKL